MESMNEYGSRVGVRRLIDIFSAASATFFARAIAFEQNPEVAKAVVEDGHAVRSHGYRWEEVSRLSQEEERKRISLAIRNSPQRSHHLGCETVLQHYD
jgi:peptidoglycan/xylan/chitin deacetylase (PgdA/CDA1 family)